MTDAFGFGMAFYLQDKASAEMGRLQHKMRDLIGTSDSLGAAYEKGISGMKAGGAMAAAGVGILAGLGSAVSVSMDFNKAVSEVGAISRASSEDLTKLKEQAMQLGESTAYTAKQSAEAQKFLAMAGFKTNQIIGAMPGLLDLAAASNTDLATTADIVSDTLTAMGMSAEQTSFLASQMAYVTTRSNTSVVQLGEALKYVTATASQLNISSGEMLAFSGMLGDIGLKGSVAGTSMENFLSHISNIKKGKMSDAFSKLGLTMSDVVDKNGDLRTLSEIIPKLQDGLVGMGNAEAGGVLEALFGKIGKKSVNAFLKQSGKSLGESMKKDFTQFASEVSNVSEDFASQMKDEMLDNLTGDVTKLRSAMEGLAIRIGDKLEPSLRIVTQGVNSLVTKITEFVNSPFGDVVVKATAALGTMLVAAGGAYSAISALKMGFTLFIPLLKAGAFAGATALAPLIGGVVAVSAALGTAWVGVTKFQDAFKKFEEGSRGVFADEGALMYLERIGGFLTGVWEVLKSVNSEGFSLPKKLDDALGDLGGGVKDAVISAGMWIGKFRKFFVDGFEVMGKVLKPIGDAFSELWVAAKPVMIELGNALSGVFGDLFQTSGQNMESWGTAGEMAFGILSGALYAVLVPLKWIAEGITEGIAFWQKYKEEIKTVGSVVWGAIKTIWAMASLPFRMMWDIGVGIVKGMQGGFESGWGAFKTSMLQTVYDTIALLPGGEILLDTLGFERPKDYVAPQQQQKVMQGAEGFAGTLANSQYGLPNDMTNSLSQMQATNTKTTGQLAKKANEAPTQAANAGASSQPIVIQNVTTLDGRVLAESVNEVNKKQANRSYGYDS